jgi:hypothetical protein
MPGEQGSVAVVVAGDRAGQLVQRLERPVVKLLVGLVEPTVVAEERQPGAADDRVTFAARSPSVSAYSSRIPSSPRGEPKFFT